MMPTSKTDPTALRNPFDFKPRIVKVRGKPVEAVFDYNDWRLLVEAIEDLADSYVALVALRDPGQSFPLDLIRQIAEGCSPIAVFRKHRGMTQANLADKAKLNRLYISQLETGHRVPSLDALSKIAEALSVGPALLVPETEPFPARQSKGSKIDVPSSGVLRVKKTSLRAAAAYKRPTGSIKRSIKKPRT